MDASIDSGNFSVRSYLPLIQTEFTTCIHGLAVYVKEGLPFTCDFPLKYFYVFDWLYFTQGFTYFYSTNHFLNFMHGFSFYLI